MWLDAQGHSECVCVNEKAWGGQILPVGVAGDEADTAAMLVVVEVEDRGSLGQTNSIIRSTRAWRSSSYPWGREGWSDFTGETSSENGRRRRRSVVFVVGVLEHARTSGWFWEMRREMGITLGWSRGPGGGWARRNRRGCSSETGGWLSKIRQPGGVSRRDDRGEREKSHWRFNVHGQGD